MLIFLPLCMYCSPGGLNLSQSRRRQRVSLDSWENLDSVKKCVSTVEKSRSRLRLLDFISTSMSRPKVSIEIKKCVDFCIFSSRFLNPSRLFIIFRLKRPQQCWDFSTNLDNLDASRQISTILTCLDNLDKNLDASKSRLKSLNFKNLDREKKKSISTLEKISTL